MTDVVKEYIRGRDDTQALRDALLETKSVLTAKKSGQISMKELWLKKKELEESLRILNDLEWLKASGKSFSMYNVCFIYTGNKQNSILGFANENPAINASKTIL
jgi:hypothetical protein